MEQTSVELSICFDDMTPAIWDQRGKQYLKSISTENMRKRLQQSLDEFFLRGTGNKSLEIDDPSFFFRYGSGGTLPIMHFEWDGKPQAYYCLFYRDIYPIGWNIANGGTDNREELLNPQKTIERELREELIVADFSKGIRYIFPADEAKPLDHPAHDVARHLWDNKRPDLEFDALKLSPIEVSWENAPDSINIIIGRGRSIKRHGFFLNINGEDFGIECDRVGHIQLSNQVTLLGGEIDRGRLVNCPIGLFHIDRFSTPSSLEEQNYPDLFFFDGKLYTDSSELTRILKGEYAQYMMGNFTRKIAPIRTEGEIKELDKAINANRHCAFCPVTERIMKRYLASRHGTIAQSA
jgi:hypothetical protein